MNVSSKTKQRSWILNRAVNYWGLNIILRKNPMSMPNVTLPSVILTVAHLEVLNGFTKSNEHPSRGLNMKLSSFPRA